MPASGSLAIRPATEPAHLVAIQRLARAIWREHYPGIISRAQVEYMLAQRYSLEALRRDAAERGIRHDRALVAGELVGYASHGPVAGSGETLLQSLYLRADVRRNGLGRALVEHVVECARKDGSRRVVLTVNRHNEVAIAAYRRYGFRVRRPVVTDIGGAFVMDDYRMELDV